VKIILHSTVKDSIPLLEYYLEKGPYKGLVFVQHGYQSTKERGGDMLSLGFARLGYFVVAIDAFKHGERIQEPYITGSEIDRLNEAFVVVKRTAFDIARLHHNHYRIFDTFDMVGVSLGGMVAYYLATRTPHIRKLVPVISTPDFLAQAKNSVQNSKLDIDTFFTPDKLQFIESINPLTHLDKLMYKELFILCGSQDPVVPMKESVDFYNTHKSKHMNLKIYEVDHTVSREMQKDIYDFIERD